MKIYLLLLLSFIGYINTQAQNEKYLAGAVPQNEQGVVVFTKTYQVHGKTQKEIFNLLKEFTNKYILHGENVLPQTRYVEDNDSLLALRVEEYLYFKKKAWVTHRTRFFYDLVYHISNHQFVVSMQRLHYLYDAEETPNNKAEDYRAENWITDKEALNKKGQLTRIAGKFRRFTIDRKNQIFLESAQAAGAKIKTKTIIVED